MQRLTTLLLLVGITFTAQAQIVPNYQPDADGDGCIGLSDMLVMLSVFGSCEPQGFQCGDPVSYQGYDYATVLIGEQCWFAENLRSELYSNGDSIPSNLNSIDWISTNYGATALVGEGDCDNVFAPDFDACDPQESLANYGRLYNWFAVQDFRGLCPSGWHVPSDTEWTDLEILLGMDEGANSFFAWRGENHGEQLKATYGWHAGGDGNDFTGFSALPGGARSWASGDTGGAGKATNFWTSSLYDNSGHPYHGNPLMRGLSWNQTGVYRGAPEKTDGDYVRCIQDSAE